MLKQAHSHQAPGARAEWKAGWSLVLAAMMGISFAPYTTFSVGFMVKPLQAEFGWSRGQITGVLAMQGFAMILLSPMIGYLVDRLGPRRIALWAIVLHALSLAAISFAGPNIWSWFGLWALATFFWMGLGSPVWTTAVVSRFDKSRALALALTLAGHGIAITVVPLIVGGWTLRAFGWRGSFVVLAIIGALTTFPVVYRFFFDSREQARRSSSALVQIAPEGFTIRQTLRQPRYWRLALAMLMGGSCVGPLQGHFVPLLQDQGMTTEHAAIAVAMTGPATIAGRLLGGVLMDRIFPPFVAAGMFVMPAVVCLILLNAGGALPLAILAAVTLGLAVGAEVDTISVLVSRYFGLRAYGRIYAPLVGIYGIGVSGAGALAGVAFDRLGSYDMVLGVAGVAVIIPVVVFATLGRFPTLPQPTKDDAALV